ncbi:MAG: NAD(P)-binding protein [Deltaproteobacteria bacterium]
MSLVPRDLTPVARATWQKGVGARRWQLPAWVDHLPPCNSACPAGENVQSWLAHARAGDFELAWQTLVSDNPLPAVHGRACYHPCETRCNRKDLDQAVAIHAVERFLGDLALERMWAIAPGQDTGKRVLVVGAGPAGLACAWQLRRLGHTVEIRDAMAEPGGMLRYGIPAYRLPRSELEREIARVLGMGITLRTNTRVDDLPSALRADNFDACFVAIGTHAGNHLDIPAVDGRPMLDAITMLEQLEAGQKPQLGRVVGVVGGGNTALDAARVAKRLGAEEAILIYRRDRGHMRADAQEVEEAFFEGVKAQWLRQPVRFGKDGVTVEKLELCEDGSLKPTGVLETLPVDALVLALGQHAELGFLRNLPGVAFGGDDSVQVDERLMTGRSGVFAGGDVIGGARTMTAATGHGKKAARAIDAWLRGATTPARPKAPPIDFGQLNLPLFLDARRSQRRELSLELRSDFAEIVAGIDEGQARYEAERCLSCGNCFECDSCFAACPEQAVIKLGKGRGYAVDPSLCTGCAVCFEQCPCHAIEMLPEAAESGTEKRPSHFKLRP